MNYAICRVNKIKTFSALVGSAKHTFRENPTLNANVSISHNNKTVGMRSSGDLKDAVAGLLPAKKRKDAVICIEYMITASPESFKRFGGSLCDYGGLEGQRETYFGEALKWLIDRHGRENVVTASLHLDETTPHLVVYVVPMTKDGRLSCKDFLGGPKKLSAMQDSFFYACGKSFNLQRGIKWTHAKHEDIRAFYGAIESGSSSVLLRKSDYAAAALGFKTKAWQQEQDRMAILASESRIRRRQEKRTNATSRVLGLERRRILDSRAMLDSERRRLDILAKELSERKIAVEAREVNFRDNYSELDYLRSQQNELKSELRSAKLQLAINTIEKIHKTDPRSNPPRNF
jgi:hypothetical protein